MKAIKTGRITPLPDGRIDPVKADREWEANTQPTQKQAATASAAQPAMAPEPARAATTAPPYSVSRAQREAINARMAKLDLDERTGKLVSADEVRVAVFTIARQVRDRLQQIPRTLAPEIVATVVADPDPRAVEMLLDDAIRGALEELSKAPI